MAGERRDQHPFYRPVLTRFARILLTMLTQIIKVALWITIVGNGIEIIRAVSRIATNDIIPQVTGKS